MGKQPYMETNPTLTLLATPYVVIDLEIKFLKFLGTTPIKVKIILTWPIGLLSEPTVMHLCGFHMSWICKSNLDLQS